MNQLNGKLYTQCPRAIYLGSSEARYIVSTYFNCKKINTYPFQGPPTSQTFFTTEVFDFIEEFLARHKDKKEQEMIKASKK